MALNKKKSRAIIVNGIPCRYVIRHSSISEDHSYKLNISVQHENGNGCYLIIEGIYTRDFWLDISKGIRESSDYVAITPGHISKLIRLALEKGWVPTAKAPPFRLKTNSTSLSSL